MTGKGKARFRAIADLAGGAALGVALILALAVPAQADWKRVTVGSSKLAAATNHLAKKSLDVASLQDRPNVYSLWNARKLADPGEEVTCLAENIYFEARNEPYQGRVAVGHVVLNRVASPQFPDSICKVIRQGGQKVKHRCQFSWYCDGLDDVPRPGRSWNESVKLASLIYSGKTNDPSRGAMWYHADYVSPAWRHDFKKSWKIGQHIFYRR